jgi:hypothetical protein
MSYENLLLWVHNCNTRFQLKYMNPHVTHSFCYIEILGKQKWKMKRLWLSENILRHHKKLHTGNIRFISMPLDKGYDAVLSGIYLTFQRSIHHHGSWICFLFFDKLHGVTSHRYEHSTLSEVTWSVCNVTLLPRAAHKCISLNPFPHRAMKSQGPLPGSRRHSQRTTRLSTVL